MDNFDSDSEENKTLAKSQNQRVWHTISDKIDKRAMDKIDVSTNKDTGIDLKAEMEKYLGGDDEIL